MDVTIRPLAPSDSMAELTALLHAAYAAHARAGRRFFASYQSVDDTRNRVARGECWLAFDDRAMVGAVTIAVPLESPQGYPAGPHAGTFYQLAVSPEHCGKGLGGQLLRVAEQRILELGATEVVIDTSCRATDLLAWYERHGYAPVGRWRWSVTNYESVVLRKPLQP